MITGHMQDYEFNLTKILKHAARWHGNTEVVTDSIHNGIHRTSYKELYKRTKQLANALKRLGANEGDRIGTMAWNTWRHMECWYAIGGIGAISHTLNPRLPEDQLDYIINHAENNILLADTSFIPKISKMIDRLKTIKTIIVLADKEHMPNTQDFPVPVLCYEDLIAKESSDHDWIDLDENSASSLCYTSGTTGKPKGVLYSHRSNMIHAFASIGGDVLNNKASDSMLMIVPMFHANSWGLTFTGPMVGTKLVMPGPHMKGENIYNLLTTEKCTLSAAVPTIWTGLLNYLKGKELSLPYLKEVIIGGSAVPRSMIEIFKAEYDVDVIQAWGMTETSPIGTVNRLLPYANDLDPGEKISLLAKQGRVPFGIDMKIVDDEGNDLPHDGVAFGRLLVKGPWIIERYFKSDETALDAEGWLDTGDVATINEHGVMNITDRAKDVIKSGGEWISSVDIENSAIAHPELQIAACIGIKHGKWEERPLLVAVKQGGCNPSKKSILETIANDHARWQIPDDIVFIDEMPLTATGKIDKKPLRAKFMNYYIDEKAG